MEKMVKDWYSEFSNHNSFVDIKLMLSVLLPILRLFCTIFFFKSTAKALLLKFIKRKKKEDNNRQVHQICFEWNICTRLYMSCLSLVSFWYPSFSCGSWWMQRLSNALNCCNCMLCPQNSNKLCFHANKLFLRETLRYIYGCYW